MTLNEEDIKGIELRKKILETVAVGFGLVGAVVILLSLMIQPINLYPDTEHLTDPTIPVNQLDNATYTFTAREFEEARDIQMIGVFTGLALIVPAYVALVAAPKSTELHKMKCPPLTDFGDISYCPDCGLKLSRLNKKG